jgi:hypothetical protein
MTTSIRPFETKGFFTIHNCVFDVLMPDLSPNGFKVLCVAIRQTLGWHKDTDLISYSQFAIKSGIKSKTTVGAAIKECLEKGYLIRIEQTSHTNLGMPSYFYKLNTEFEINPVPEIGIGDCPVPEIGTGSVPEIGTGSVPEIGHTKEHKEQHHVDADYLLSSLLDQGVDKAQARKLIKAGLTQELLDAWLEYIDTHNNLQNPTGFLVSRLKLGEFPPDPRQDREDTNRYLGVGSEFEDLIQH